MKIMEISKRMSLLNSILFAICMMMVFSCGSNKSNKKVKIDQVFGGKFEKVCISDNKIWIARSYEVQEWSLQDSPQVIRHLQALDPNTNPPIAHIKCEQKDPEYISRSMDSIEKAKFSNHQLEPHKHISLLIQEDGILLHDQKEMIKAWKFNAVSLNDAILDGDIVWAVSKQGIWRWKTNHKNAELIELPKDVVGEIIDLSKDGDWILLKNKKQQIFPIQVIPQSQEVPEQKLNDVNQQPFSITDAKHSPFKVLLKQGYESVGQEHKLVEIGFKEGMLKFEKGQLGFEWKMKGDDQFQSFLTPAIHQLLILDESSFLLATQQGISIWSYEEESKYHLKEIQNLPIGETIQAFLPSQIIAKNQTWKDEKRLQRNQVKTQLSIENENTLKKENISQENDLYFIGRDFGFAKGKWQVNFTESDLK